ncbi:M15 family metallopeptidase [Flagellimonas olearia]|uniref:D-alanyl-D-alanine dipeptidase n=1 Tax=Flagellimonas olearia TaxID=552546 RepID=A0A444VL13_9FLAO|nr:M15 family metallopeptidase [Allomuricauda olearia]RYC51466.1 peptidase M15 [Allomuricauda olearia]
MRYCIMFLGLMSIFSSCHEKPKEAKTEEPVEMTSIEMVDSIVVQESQKELRTFEGLADTTFVRLADFSDDFAYDLRYATENNFLKAKVYDCAECYTRVKTAKALIKANADFKEKGVRIKFFDCYRPNSVQYKMWAIVPNPQYVANPEKGSIHNKGGAVDITLEDLEGNELDMGTDFDFFGKRAYHDNLDLPKEILENRKLLKETMESHGFWSIRTEWWHYNLSAGSNDKVANFKWDCPE